MRKASPGVVINGRLIPGWGDYDSTADRPANFPPHDGDWEGIPTTNESYGWNPRDRSHKLPEHFIRLLAKAAARGGNTLLNVGPMGDGEMDPKDLAILHGIGVWWKVNGESIRGTRRTTLPVQSWGESTRRGNTLYLHIFAWPADGQLVVGGLKSRVSSARLLALAEKLPVSRVGPLDVAIALPRTAPDLADSVVVLECGDAAQTDAAVLLQPTQGSQTLRAFDGQLHGTLRFGAGKKSDDFAQNWRSAADSVSWAARLVRPAEYEVFVNYDAVKGSAGGTYLVQVGDQRLSGVVQVGLNQQIRLGRVRVPAGPVAIQVIGTGIKGDELFRLRHLVLNASDTAGT